MHVQFEFALSTAMKDLLAALADLPRRGERNDALEWAIIERVVAATGRARVRSHRRPSTTRSSRSRRRASASGAQPYRVNALRLAHPLLERTGFAKPALSVSGGKRTAVARVDARRLPGSFSLNGAKEAATPIPEAVRSRRSPTTRGESALCRAGRRWDADNDGRT